MEMETRPMETIVDRKLEFHRDITQGGRRWIGELLRREGISILPGFMERIALVRAFFRRYYGAPGPRVVLCGINPGRLGAGRTGLPFIDFQALSELMPGCRERGRERSARFVAGVIGHFGARRFFDGVYLTNLSWFGFEREGRNVNVDALPVAVQREIRASLAEELKIVRPKAILPVGKAVAAGLAAMAAEGMLTWPVGTRLEHPRYCAFPSRSERARARYIGVLAAQVGPEHICPERGGPEPREPQA